MQRFFLEELDTKNYSFTLINREIINQIVKVLRSKLGDKVIFFDGEDLYDYIFEIKEIGKKEIIFEQIDRLKKESEVDFELNLFQAIPNKMDKIESIIKNGTQIGITNFLFFKAERSQKLNISEKKKERLNKIILEASEQSERNIIPSLIIGDKIDFKNLEGQNLFFHTKNNKSELLKNIKIESSGQINLFVGPEGGFSDLEIEEFKINNFTRIYLGDRILRTELAGISSAFSIIQNNL